MNQTIGKRIKKLRTQNKMTLKDLSSLSGLSVGFLSQLERGLTSIAVDTLEELAQIFKVEISYFFNFSSGDTSHVMKSYEKKILNVTERSSIQYCLSKELKDKKLLPRLIEVLPGQKKDNLIPYKHEGEEFIYILEGVLTIIVNGIKSDLYPGDSAHYLATTPHNWTNHTNQSVKLIAVHTPNFLVDVDGEIVFRSPVK